MIEFLTGLVVIGAVLAIVISLAYLMGKLITRKDPLIDWQYTAAIGLLGLLAIPFFLAFLALIYEIGHLILIELL